MISERNAKRIRDDAYIAWDACQSIMLSPNLTEDYIHEKLEVIRRCVEFIQNFEEVRKNN